MSEYAIPAMQWAYGTGFIGGTEGESGGVILDSQDSAARGQTVAMLL